MSDEIKLLKSVIQTGVPDFKTITEDVRKGVNIQVIW